MSRGTIAGPAGPAAPRVLRVLMSAAGIYATAAPFAAGLRVVVAIVTGAAPVATAWLTRSLLDGLTGHGAGPGVWPCALGMAVSGAAVAIAQHVSSYADGEIGRRVTSRAQNELFAAVIRNPGLTELEDPVFQDRLRLAQQAMLSGPQQLGDSALSIAQSTLMVGGFLAALASSSPTMAILVTASAIPALWAQLRLSRRRADTAKQNSPRLRRQMFYSSLLTDARAGKEIRLFGLGPLFGERMATELTDAQAAERSVSRAALRVDGSLAVLTAAVSAIALLSAVARAKQGHGGIGDISILIAALAGVQGGLAAIVAQLASLNQTSILFGNFIAITRGPSTTGQSPEPRTGLTPTPLRSGIEFHDVWFRYGPNRPWILRGVNLVIPQGRSVALVGLNGAGKSTLVKLLCRLYEPTRGTITWDGIDIRDMDPAALRARIGAVFQDYMTYDLSVADNIGVGDLSAAGDHGRLAAAAEQAGAADTIKALPRGYQTMLSRIFVDEGDDSGVILSGGQWQRLAIARAILRSDADLLILDEPSSGLDAVAEGEIQESLRRLREGRSSLLISHRLNTVRNADLIVVLEAGVIVEAGDHDSLVEAGGGYAELFRIQADGYQLANG